MSSFVRSQYESLKAAGLDMLLMPVRGHGAKAYLKAIWRFRKLVRKEQPDIIHAHYSVCGYVAVLATLGMRHKPKVMVSILGSFPKKNNKWRLVRFCIKHLWDKTLVKSARTRDQLGLELPVIPNGVNLNTFQLMDHEEARRMVGFTGVTELENEGVREKKYVIWCSHPTRPEKNWKLAQAAVKELVNERVSELGDVELVAVYDKKPQEVATYMNAADCLLLTSWSEGSPNVIKEAMACNCPIVTTDVGDVNERLKGLDGCYIVRDNELESERVRELGNAIEEAIEFGKRTEGRKRLVEDGLTIELTAKKIIKLYESVI